MRPLILAPALVFAVLWGPASGVMPEGEWIDSTRWGIGTVTHTFDDPIDALSLGMHGDIANLAVSGYLGDNRWTAWEHLEIDNEQDPLLQETNLVMFPRPVHAIKVRGTTLDFAVHPVRISQEPARIEHAATANVGHPRILTRRQWGADESLLYRQASSSSSAGSAVSPQSADNGDNGGSASARVSECETAQLNYPQEFKASRTVTTVDGRELTWKQQFSPSVKLIAVHHTAMQATGEARSGLERMRALYQYHTLNRGWGDVGYHFVIDEEGQIYEGRAGGSYVIGGHAYCNNIGTVGVALMGNFDFEKPTQEQMHALQWLLDDLAQVYDIDLASSVQFHGKTYASPIVRHGDLVSTACPGYYVRETIGQIRKNVIAGNFTQDIRFPVIARATSSRSTTTPRRTTSSSSSATTNTTLRAAGSTSISASPGGKTRLTLVYTPIEGAKRRERIADVRRSNIGIGLWQEVAGTQVRVPTALFAPDAVRPGQSAQIPLLVQAPRAPGSYSFTIGSVAYSLTVTRGGNRSVDVRGRTYASSASSTTYRPGEERPLAPRAGSSSSSRSSAASSRSSAASSRPRTSDDHTIRIKLTVKGAATLGFAAGSTARITASAGRCATTIGSEERSGEVLRFTPEEFGVISLADSSGTRTYRGVIECRVLDGALTLINELSLEDYLLGLAEEPDTEPYEKQRAFAIAARTYALWYLDPANRKFPGKPYDGSDSPAEFQVYRGITFEDANPRWTDAVRATSREVLTYNGNLIKPPYFSSSDGRTRSPKEAGWGNFPYAEIFASKPDPWCAGMTLRGHGVGMSGCGAKAQANEGKTAEEILRYYYAGTAIETR